MDEAVFQEPTAEESKQLQDAIRQLLLQIQLLRERMKMDQEDIEQSHARTEAMLARMKPVYCRKEGYDHAAPTF